MKLVFFCKKKKLLVPESLSSLLQKTPCLILMFHLKHYSTQGVCQVGSYFLE